MSTNCAAISSAEPVKKQVSVLRLGGSNTFLVDDGEPGMSVLDVSAPRASAFQT